MSNLVAGVILVGALAFLILFTLWALAQIRRDDAVVVEGDGRGRPLPPIDEADPNQIRTWNPDRERQEFQP